jgi:site-specific DNA recombinase
VHLIVEGSIAGEIMSRLRKDGQQLDNAGYRGATLGRPALERRRDVVASGSVDRLSVPAPDRLARQYAYQVLLGDAFRRAGGAVIFRNRAWGQSPDDDLRLPVQGMSAA